MKRFLNRRDGGRRLAERLKKYSGRPDVVVLALPRGGVPVAYEIAGSLGAPLDVLLVRKVGVPGREELAMGAIAGGGALVVNRNVVDALGVSTETFEACVEAEREELARRETAYRSGGQPLSLDGKTVILVDDGLATGASMRVAVAAARRLGAESVVVAVPTGARESCAGLAAEVDDVVCLVTPQEFRSVGMWYESFDQVSDDEVRELLAR